MEPDVHVLTPEAAMERIAGLLEQTEPVPLVITGNSMYPFLHHGRDTVYLQNLRQPLKKGDMVLYRRKSGQYILHRIVSVQSRQLTLLGDNQVNPEPGIAPEQVLAVVSAVRRGGKLLRPGDSLWRFYEKVWLRVIPLRPYLMAIYRRLTGKKPADLE